LELLAGKAKRLVLFGPFRQVGEASDAHAVRKTTVDGRFN